MKNYTLILLLVTGSLAHPINAQDSYKITTYQAAPGKLLDLIALIKSEQNSEKGPFMMRHSQGDQWDLMTIELVESYSNYLQAKPTRRSLGSRYADLVSQREDLFATGPQHQEFRGKFNQNGFYHIEMFVALPEKHDELLWQRKMENTFLKEIGREPNHIFVSDFGSRFDMFTLGYYRDIKHFAESADIPDELQQQAAIKAGFKGADRIGTYLRELISEHHDTLANKVN